jgi:hypothetical protein
MMRIASDGKRMRSRAPRAKSSTPRDPLFTGALSAVCRLGRAVSTETSTAGGRTGVDWRRAEFVLTLLAFLGFLTLPIRITTIYSGLPAHPLFVHAPVVLIPITIVAAIVFVIKPAWLSRYGIGLDE